jgi:ABC-type branched-subunit amino acid transport system substrate-binding protein
MNSTLKTITVAIIFCAALVFTGCGQTPKATGKPVVKIGVALPLSGNEAAYGESVRDALLMRLNEAAKENQKFEYKIIFENDESMASKVALAVKKFIAVDHVDVLLSAYGFRGAPTAPMAEEWKVPMITFGTWREKFWKTHDYTFVMGTVMKPEVDLFVNACRGLGSTKFGYLGWLNPDGVELTQYLKKRLPQESMELTAEEEHSDELLDFRTTLLKLNDNHPMDALLVIAFDPQMQIILKQWHIMGDPKPLVTVEGFDGIADEPLTEGHWYPCLAPANGAWVGKYKGLYKNEPMYGANFAYDALTLVMRGCERFDGAGKPSREWIAQALKKAEPMEGAGGRWVMKPDGIMDAPAVLYRIEKGKIVETSVEELVKMQKEGKLYRRESHE